MGVYIPNMSKPKKGEVIAFDDEYAVYTDDNMQVHRYSLIEIDDELFKKAENAYVLQQIRSR